MSTDPDDRSISIEAALHWAFAVEYATLDLPLPADAEPSAGVGIEWVLIQRAKLGNVMIQGGRGHVDQTHYDAHMIADVVMMMPESLGGQRMAVFVTELARTGSRPDWMPGAVPVLKPIAWDHTSGMGMTEQVDTYIEARKAPHPRWPGRTVTIRKRHKVEWTPCKWTPTLHQITQKRYIYSAWHDAISFVWHRLTADCRLEKIQLNDRLPDPEPWSV